MKNLISANPSMFPLRASLFYKRPNGQPGSTWDYLARDTKDQTKEVIDKQIAYNSNCMTSLIFNMVDPNLHVVNPFAKFLSNKKWVYPTAMQVMSGHNTIDEAELLRWQSLISWGVNPDLWFIPCWFCGDDKATTSNTVFQNFFLPYAIPWIDQYAKAHIISTEASKSMNIAQQGRMIELFKRYTNKPVGVHNQGTNISAVADFLMYEYKNHPKDGDNRSVSDVIAETKKVLATYPKFIWFQELNWNPEGQIARNQSRAIRDLSATENRIIGLPGPV